MRYLDVDDVYDVLLCFMCRTFRPEIWSAVEGLVVSFAANDARGMARNLIAAASDRVGSCGGNRTSYIGKSPVTYTVNHRSHCFAIAAFGWMWLDVVGFFFDVLGCGWGCHCDSLYHSFGVRCFSFWTPQERKGTTAVTAVVSAMIPSKALK